MTTPTKKELTKQSALPASLLELYSKLCPDHDFGLTDEGKARLERIQQRDQIAPNTVCMTCPGNINTEASCPWARHMECLLLSASPDVNLPRGEPCPQELHFYVQRVTALVAGIQLSDPDDQCTPSEQLQCQKIAQQDVHIARIERDLSRRPDPTIMNSVGVDVDKQVVYREEMNPAYAALASLERQRNALQRELRQEVANRLKFVKIKRIDIDGDTVRERIKNSNSSMKIIEAEVQTKSSSMISKIRKKGAEHEDKIRVALGSDDVETSPPEEDDGPAKLEL